MQDVVLESMLGSILLICLRQAPNVDPGSLLRGRLAESVVVREWWTLGRVRIARRELVGTYEISHSIVGRRIR